MMLNPDKVEPGSVVNDYTVISYVLLDYALNNGEFNQEQTHSMLRFLGGYGDTVRAYYANQRKER